MKDMVVGDDKDFNVYFCRSSIKFPDVKAPAIIFSPIDDGWNDFRYKCSYKYLVHYGDGRRELHGQVFLGFVATDERIESNGRISKEIEVVRAGELPDFFTLQGEMKDYREFVNEHGVNESNRLLLAFNDLVASKRVVKRKKLVESAIKTDVFILAFMRDSGRFFAFHNAVSIIDGLEGEDFSSISTKLSISYSLAGFSKPHGFDLNFDVSSVLPKRISVLIGRNGLGKSQALHAIVKSLVKGDKRFFDRELGRPLISRLLAIATPGETVNTFPPERGNKRVKYQRLMLNGSAKTRNSRGFCDLCVQLARSEEFVGYNERWGLFKESARFLSNVDSIVLPLNKGVSVAAGHVLAVRDNYYVPLLKLNHGGEQARLEVQGGVTKNADPMVCVDGEVLPLSSGQLAFIKFLVQACLFIENGTLVLLDEPETHLHPNFISEFVRVLDRLLKLTGSIAIIATHSAYFVREVPRTQVLVFKSGVGGQVDIHNPRLKTFGADVGAISYFVFEDEITNALVDDICEQFPQAPEDRQKLLKELELELSADVVMYLRRKLNIQEDNEEN